MRGRQRTWTDEQLRRAVARATNFTDVLRELGLRPAGGNQGTVKRYAARLGLDTAHFSTDRRTAGLRAASRRAALPFEQVFCERSRALSSVLRRHARRLLAPAVCAECANPGRHNGRPLTLQLDHINGVPNDNRVENLRWLCPNCHSRTATYAGRTLGGAGRVRERSAVPAWSRRSAVPVAGPLTKSLTPFTL